MADEIDELIADELWKAQVLVKNRQGTRQDRVIVHLADRLRIANERLERERQEAIRQAMGGRSGTGVSL